MSDAAPTGAIKHIIVIPFGLGIYDERWYASTLALFEAIPFASLRAQRYGGFIALVVVDAAMPPRVRVRLQRLLAKDDRFHLVPVDLTKSAAMHHGGFADRWEHCLDFLLARRLVTDPFEYVITSVLDADDALHVETTRLVQGRFRAALPGLITAEAQRLHWLSHTNGMVLTFPHGLRWFAHRDVVQRFEYPFLGMGVFVLTRLSSGISVCSSRHSQWGHYGSVLAFASEAFDVGHPMWVYVRHDRSHVGWELAAEESEPAAAASLAQEFGIDFAKIAKWRAANLPKPGVGNTPPEAHPGLASGEQRDRHFRIAALNRQIAALESEAGRAGSDGEFAALLARQRTARKALIDGLRRHGRMWSA